MASSISKGTKKPQFQSGLATTLFFIVLFTIPAFFLLRSPPDVICTSLVSHHQDNWSGDLRDADFAWNRLPLLDDTPPPTTLKIAVFSRKWPVGTVPGGMERHAHTLHTALARRGHQVHVFTSPPASAVPAPASKSSPYIHWHDGEPGQWRYNMAWDQFAEVNTVSAFDVVHSESVALPYWRARNLPNLAVSWHGIALESLHSDIYQDLTRRPGEHMSPSFNYSIRGDIPKVLNEIRFFRNYAHHVAISDSCGEMLRDVYQIPDRRVHVILNGVNDADFVKDDNLGRRFRDAVGVPKNATVVFGVAGRLVKDKGHPILHAAYADLIARRDDVYLIVAGSGPWESRYRDFGSRALVLGSLSPAELRRFYNAIDVFLNPTLRPGGLDLTLMEAMMSGKAVMASRFPSIKGSIVVDPEFGLMFSPNVESLSEALEKAAAEGAERLAERGTACRRYALSMFTATKMALAYERLFLCMKNETFCGYP